MPNCSNSEKKLNIFPFASGNAPHKPVKTQSVKPPTFPATRATSSIQQPNMPYLGQFIIVQRYDFFFKFKHKKIFFLRLLKKYYLCGMNILGKITGIKYKVLLSEDLQTVEIDKFNINKVSTACILKDGNASYAVSKWVSPKRTRSYPYERI